LYYHKHAIWSKPCLSNAKHPANINREKKEERKGVKRKKSKKEEGGRRKL
jgi:hypothetical protein